VKEVSREAIKRLVGEHCCWCQKVLGPSLSPLQPAFPFISS
jgi:hypothetical protein